MKKILFVGDIALNNGYEQIEAQGIDPFEAIAPMFEDTHFLIGNLEAGEMGNEGVNPDKRPALVANGDALNLLSNLHLDIALLANNHIYDALHSGYQNTIRRLDKLQIQYVGAGTSKEDAANPLFFEWGGHSVCLFNYLTADTNPRLPDDAKVYLNVLDDPQSIVQPVREAKKKADFVILNVHWGGKMENGYFPQRDQRVWAHELVDMGVDLIIGHHSHTVQPYEKYKGKYIYYSLGNFCFDNIHEGTFVSPLYPRKKKGAIVTLKIKDGKLVSKLSYIRNKELRIVENKLFFINVMFRQILFPLVMLKPVWTIYKYQFKLINPVVQYFFYFPGTLSEKLRSISFRKLMKFFR